MKKKIFLVILVIFIIIVVLFLINLGRNFVILKNIFNSNNEFKNNLSDNYLFEEIVEFSNGSFSTLQNTLYVCNGTYLLKTYYNNTPYTVHWYDSNTNELVSFDENGSTNNSFVGFTQYINHMFLNKLNNEDITISTILCQNLFTPFTVENNCYIINVNNSTIYINKETCLIERILSGTTTLSFKLQENIVSDQNVTKPNSL